MTELEPVVVRRARERDAQALRDLALSILVAHRLRLDRELLTYGRPAGDAIELVAVAGEAPVGTITLSPHPRRASAGWISKFFVDPLARGHGVGRALLGGAIAEARRLAFRSLELETLSIFPAAIHLYEATGWVRAPARGAGVRRYLLDLRA
jgi:GNAT superfamily N-acetyltransferase